MIIYENGKPVETLTPDEAKVMSKILTRGGEVEICYDDGTPMAKLVRGPINPWDPSLTKEELDRRCRESPRMTLTDFWKKMGAA